MLPFGRFSDQERRFTPDRALATLARDARMIAAVYLAVAAISIWGESWAAVVFWLVPRVAGEPVMRFIRMSEHGACPRVPDMLRNTRTVVTFFLPRWLAWNNAFHAEHHHSPMTPFHALPALHDVLRPHLAEVRNGYVETQRVLIRHAAGAGAAASAQS